MKQSYLIILLAFFTLFFIAFIFPGLFDHYTGMTTPVSVIPPVLFLGKRYLSLRSSLFRIISIISHGNSTFPHYMNPEPFRSIVGIKFDNNQDGKKIARELIKYSRKPGKKEMAVSDCSFYQQIAPVTISSVLVRG